jgi:hypothetical protein
MAPCIIDFIGANALLGPVGGREGALDTPGPLNGIKQSEYHLGPGVSRAPSPTGPSNAFAPMKSIMHRAIYKNQPSIGRLMVWFRAFRSG